MANIANTQRREHYLSWGATLVSPKAIEEERDIDRMYHLSHSG